MQLTFMMGGSSYEPVSSLLSLVFIGVVLFSLWQSSYIFLFKSSNNQLSLSKYHGYALAFGAAYTFIGAVVWILFSDYSNIYSWVFISFFRFGLAGIVILPPAIHLYIECSRQKVNKGSHADLF